MTSTVPLARFHSVSISLVVFFLSSTALFAQFDTVINVPPDSIGDGFVIGSSCQANIFAGGVIGFGAQAGPGSDIEVNVFNGTVGGKFVMDEGTTLNLMGGNIEFGLQVGSNAVLNVFQGQASCMPRMFAGSETNLFGGSLDAPTIDQGALINVMGGTIGGIGFAGGNINMTSGEISIPIIQPGAVWDISGGEIRLTSVRGEFIFTGGTFLGKSFSVASSGHLVLDGPTIFPINEFGITRLDGPVEIFSGCLGSTSMAISDSVSVFGGSLSSANITIESTSDIQVYGGVFVSSNFLHTGVVEMHGGSITSHEPGTGSFHINLNGQLHIFGGHFDPDIDFKDFFLSNGLLRFYGNNFLLDGVPIKGLNAGTSVMIEERDVELSGVLEDGSPISIFLDEFILGDVVVTNSEPFFGDVNLDGSVDLLDVGPFVSLLNNGGFQVEADINNDGIIDLRDVPLFIRLIIAQ